MTSQKAQALLIGILLSMLLLVFENARNIDAQNLALGKDTFSIEETWNGEPFTAYSPSRIQDMVKNFSLQSTADKKKIWLWLGNSQLHAINQPKTGDHLAPYWLKKSLSCIDCIIPLGVSVPNANLQEFLLLSQYIEQHVKIEKLIIELPFIGLREDGIRDELIPYVDKNIEANLRKTIAGNDIAQTASRKNNNGNIKKSDSSFQNQVEEWLEHQMRDYFPLWTQRSQLKTNFLIDLYYTKNWLLNIKPNTIRKVIGSRYERNMNAFQDILQRSQQNHIEIIVYIAPIRQDIQLPYDKKEYEDWKNTVEKLVKNYGGKFVNLEKLVPVNVWGTYLHDDADFMHFQGNGHKLVGEELYKHIGQ